MKNINNKALCFLLGLVLISSLAGCKSGPNGNQLLDQGKYVEAAQFYEDQLKSKPDDPVLNNQLGYSYAKLGKFDLAVASYQKAVQLKPDYPEAHYNLGFLFMSKQFLRLDDANKEFSKAIELKPAYDKAYNNRGMCYAYLGKFELGKQDIEKAISLSPNEKTYKDNLEWVKRMEQVTKSSLPQKQETKEVSPQPGATAKGK
jgi:Flp pilus assembly protein TadD